MNDQRTVVVTGATGSAGRASATALAAAGHRVIAVGRDTGSVTDLVRRLPGSDHAALVGDVTDPGAVADLAERIRDDHGRVDGVIHLVGGWRGGTGLAGNTDEDWQFLSAQIIDSLRYVTRTWHDDLVTSPAGRVAIVSAGAAARPTAGNANYATAKAAAEAWMQAVADSFRRKQSGRKTDPLPQTSAAVTFVITAIGDQDGFTTPDTIAQRVVGLFEQDAAVLNGTRIDLRPGT